MLKKLTSILLAIICCTALAACSEQSTNEKEAINSVSTNQTNTPQQDGYYPLKFTIYDDKGNEVQQTVAEEPERIVVIGQGLAELMIHFGEKDRIVGLAYLDKSYSQYEEQVSKLPQLTDTWPSKESIIALEPDLIVAMSSTFTDGIFRFGMREEFPFLQVLTIPWSVQLTAFLTTSTIWEWY